MTQLPRPFRLSDGKRVRRPRRAPHAEGGRGGKQQEGCEQGGEGDRWRGRDPDGAGERARLLPVPRSRGPSPMQSPSPSPAGSPRRGLPPRPESKAGTGRRASMSTRERSPFRGSIPAGTPSMKRSVSRTENRWCCRFLLEALPRPVPPRPASIRTLGSWEPGARWCPCRAGRCHLRIALGFGARGPRSHPDATWGTGAGSASGGSFGFLVSLGRTTRPSSRRPSLRMPSLRRPSFRQPSWCHTAGRRRPASPTACAATRPASVRHQ